MLLKLTDLGQMKHLGLKFTNFGQEAEVEANDLGFRARRLACYPEQFPRLLCLASWLNPTLCNTVDCSLPGSSVHGDSPGKNSGVGCHALLQRIFTT